MTVLPSLLAFILAASLLTITPGLDTALVLRTAAVEGPRRATMAALGISLGCLTWGAITAVGLGAVLAASPLAFEAVKWAGAAYLVWLGLNLILKPRKPLDLEAAAPAATSSLSWLKRGMLTNLLNPKVGVFYVSFLPPFVPAGVPVAPFILLLAGVHAVLGLAWSGGLILATRPIANLLRRAAVVRWLDRVTGGVFIAFAVKLALTRR